MKNFKVTAAALLAALALNACVGFVAPIPLPADNSTTTRR